MLERNSQNVKVIMTIEDLRREYSSSSLDEKEVDINPFKQFHHWFEEVKKSDIIEPNAMVIATATPNGVPSSRTVLLKGFSESGFLFFTNYHSQKANELMLNPNISVTFLWKELERQVHIRGTVEKTSIEESAKYFAKRPRKSQLGAWSSIQSSKVTREDLEKKYREYEQKFEGKDVPLPPFWGGFRITPFYFEFWQGRESRLHDRISYSLENGNWVIHRLSP